MRKLYNKGLAWALTVCIVFSLLPMSVLAVGGVGELSISGGTLDTDYSVSDNVVSILTSTAMTVIGTTTTEHIVVGTGVTANLAFNGVSIDVTNASPISVEAGGTLNLTLAGTNTLRGYWNWPDSGDDYFPAILVPSGATLNISGSGSLNAVAAYNYYDTVTPAYCYAIGAAYIYSGENHDRTGGIITISQAAVTASAYSGIGGIGADITISDGATVSLENTNTIGIGGNATDGDSDTADTPDPVSVTISGTSTVVRAVMAANPSDNTQSTGIAIGGEGCGVTINGGTVTAVGADAGIGGDGSSVTVTSGTVTATGTYTVGIGGDDCTVNIGGASTVVKAYGRYVGIGSDYYVYGNTLAGAFDITITGGDVRAWSTVTFGTAAEDWAATYSGSYSSHYWGIGGNLGCDAVGKIAISGGTVDARGYYGGIGGDCGTESADEHSTAEGSLTIDISGGTVNAVAANNSSESGIGGDLYAGDSRSITISGDAVVGAWRGLNSSDEFSGGSIIGGGDCTDSVITIKDNAKVICASVIGGSGATPSSGDNRIGHTGGVINILGSASVGEVDSSGYRTYNTGADHIGSSMDNYVIQGGDGGTITIDTTGAVGVSTIGGGDALYSAADCTGGAGGSITIKSGTLSVTHIGGGNGVAQSADYKGYGGAGGTIEISGGTFFGLYAQVTEYNYDSGRFYASAGIGGGGGTYLGGAGGTITISGGTVNAYSAVTVYDSTTGDLVSDGGSGIGIGSAGIGGGNGADGGIINISGGTVKVGPGVSPNKAATATTLPALIGGGSAGGAGQITISGGYVNPSVDSQTYPVYGDDSTSIGQGKGATDAGGWVKVTGGTLSIPLSTYQQTVARPVPWPTSADGTKVYPTTLGFYSAADLPEGLSFYADSEIVSMTITKKSDNTVYSYETNNMSPTSFFWLPIEGDVTQWTDSHELFNVTVSVKKDNTVYGFTGTISYQKNSNMVGGITSYTNLTYTGEVIETLQITSDWGNQTKTYDGTDHMPAFTVKNMAGETLTKDTDYTLKIEYSPNDGYGVKAETSVIKNAGGYYVTATGKTGTAYEGMTATLDVLWINPKHIPGIYGGGSFTKQYDGETVVYNGSTEVESITFTVDLADLCAGDVLSGIIADNPRYKTPDVGTGIEIDVNSTDYTYTQNGQACSIYNYSIDQPAITGDITVKVIGETNLDASGVTVTKGYDGNTSCTLTNVAGSVTLVDLVGTEVATVNVTGVSAFDSANAGTTRTVTLTIGGLAGANSTNYTLAGGATTVEILNASITPADYTYNLTAAQQSQEFTQGGGIAQISLPQTANGVNSETVAGAVTLWHDVACTATQATDESVNALTTGSHSLYVKFVPDASETNYDTTKITTGEVVVLTVVEGDPQDVSFATPDTMTKTYGDAPFTNAATNASDGSNTPTYSSSNTNVATVEINTGEVTINAAGTATITATVPEVEGQYRETSVSYTLTVGKKPVTVNAADATRKFGEANPAFTLENPSAVLVNGDAEADLAVSLTTTAVQTSNVGDYSVTGTSASTNYNVTVTPGTLTVTKADAPILSDISKSLLYSQAHSDVAVIVTALPVDRGTTSFAVGTVTDNDGIINGDVTATATGISFSTNSGAENQTATIPVTVTMQNYTDASVNVIVTLVDKTPVTITGVTVANKTYDGAAAAYTGTPANEQGYTGTCEYIWSGGSAPKNAGNYTLTVKIPDDNADFMGEVEIQFAISPKSLTVKPQNLSIYNGAALPTAFTMTYEGLVSGDTITPAGTPEFALKNGADALTNSSTNGTYTIEWTNKADVTVENSNYDITKADGTLTISTQPSYNGGGSSTPATPAPTVSGSTAATTATAKTGSDGTATASVTKSQMSTAITAAQKAAASTGEAPHVEIKVSGGAGASAVETTLPKAAVQALVTGKMESMTLSSPVATMTFDAKAIAAIAGEAYGDVAFTVSNVKNSTLSGAAQQLVGDRPVYNLSVTSGGSTISQFDGTVTVSLPYTPAAGEDTNAIVSYYINANGEPELMQNCHYDAKAGALVFTTTHFSTYAVGYNKIAFSDVSDTAWYADAVSYLAARGITGGTSETKFSPDATLTRGQFITLLMRAYSINADENPTDNFSDAGNTYYTGYLAAAKRLGISNGIGDNKFAPEQAITRQEMFTLLYNALKAIDQLPENDSGKTLSDFADSANISSYAQNAMDYLVNAGVVSGSNGQLSPTDTTTRTQMAQVLYNLLSK